MSTIQLVVFDIAGTTVQDKGDVAQAFIGAFREAGITIPEEDVKKVMGFRKIDAIRLLLEKFAPAPASTPPPPANEGLIEKIHTRFISNMISFYLHDKDLRPMPHAE